MKRVILALVLAFTFLIVGCLPMEPTEQYCIKQGTNARMSLTEAKIIAETSECVVDGSLSKETMCNSVTGTWWVDLDIEKEGCNPACVIDVETKTAEINWRCTGLVE